MTKEEFLKIELSQISQVYLGKNNCCRCGCGGTYTATSFMEDPRGEVDDVLVAKRLKRAKSLVSGGAPFEFGDNHINIPTGEKNALTFYTDELKN